MRVHRNAIVNLSRVQQFHMPARGTMSVALRDGSRVPLSRGYQPAVRKMLQQAGHEKNSLPPSPSTGHPIS
jgi:DNA-binding LytR/AlgR family response regulator